jgi:peroxiredoxin
VPFLIAAVVLVGVLCLLDLLLTVAVIRRLREHAERLDRLGAAPTPDAVITPGTPAPAFETAATDGGAVTQHDLGGGLLAFMSVTCTACKEQLPRFERYVADAGLPRSKVLVVVVDSDTPPAEYVAGLERFATVVVEQHEGTVGAPWQANAFPTFYSIDEQLTVRTSSFDVAGLPAPVSSTA